jgi:hypothetical protein
VYEQALRRHADKRGPATATREPQGERLKKAERM